MGAFEAFVNANLGIRKPLITDAGPPSGSAKAAGIIGSHYIDSNTLDIYEKTGENNATDWVKIRRLGDGLSDAVSAGQPFNSSFLIPSGVDTLSFNYADIGDNSTHSSAPRVDIQMRTAENSDFFYAHSIFDVSATGFSVTFSDTILETGHFLDISINKT